MNEIPILQDLWWQDIGLVAKYVMLLLTLISFTATNAMTSWCCAHRDLNVTLKYLGHAYFVIFSHLHIINTLLIPTYLIWCSYQITYLDAENVYLFSANVSVCFETFGDCYLNFALMTDVRIPSVECDFNTRDFAVSGNVLRQRGMYGLYNKSTSFKCNFVLWHSWTLISDLAGIMIPFLRANDMMLLYIIMYWSFKG